MPPEHWGQMLLLFHKPYGVLSQFKPVPGKRTLLEFPALAGGRAVGRLDEDSEGLLLITSWPWAQTALTQPGRVPKVYLAQVERIPSPEALRQLESGVTLGPWTTAPAGVRRIDEPGFPERVPPIRHRLNVPTAWIELALREGKNRQVRRMTAAVGHPTLRLVRVSVGPLVLDGLEAGQSRPASRAQLKWLNSLRSS